MTKRVHQLAKELGVDSKAIVAKCQAEGISESIIKSHTSIVSAGLEASIREWFSAGAHTSAVETAGPVNIDAAKAKPRRGRAAKPADAASSQADEPPDQPADEAATATATVEAPKKPARRAKAPHAAPGASEPADAATLVEAPPPPSAPPAAPAPESAPGTAIEAPGPHGAPAPAAPEEPAEPPARAVAARRPEPVAPAANPAPKAAPMNVPTRPTLVKPAGPKLEVKTPVKLSGPKIVRVEAPEVIEAPRARKVGPPAPAAIADNRGPRGGACPSPAPGSAEDDARGPRRGVNNKRRSSGTGVPDRRRGFAADWAAAVTTGAWSEQDLAEREARLNRASGFLKKRRQDLRRQAPSAASPSAEPESGVIRIAAPFTIKDLSAATGVKASDIIKRLFLRGVMLKINDGIDATQAQEVMLDFDLELEVTEAKTAEESVSSQFEGRQAEDLRRRGPVVTILGHVDHGKTSLLDKIRNANVAAGEAGGITQRTSAFRVPLSIGGADKEIVFLDTPGHQAFTEMRARGATMTDVVVLVVSAPEGVMPQTIESINHAKAAKVPVVVALNKIDRPDATEGQVRKTLGQLAEAGANPVEWGGDTEVVRTSATTGAGIRELLEALDYQAELLELKADFAGPARGTVIEAKVEEGRGAVANVLVQQGELKVGDFVVAGRSFGRVRDITDDRGRKQKSATPPTPVQISGLDEVPDAGDRFYAVDSLRRAQEAAEQRRDRERQIQLAQPKMTLDSLFTQISADQAKEILLVIKAAEQGTVDVLKAEAVKVSTAEIKVRVLHAAVGGITESDIILADASRAVVIGFNVIPSGKARQLAEQKGVEIRTYEVIYNIMDDLRKAAEGLLEPELRQEILGHAEVRKVFRISKVGSVAGCYVTDGIVQRDALIRVTRNDVVIENNRRLEQLKRVKDDAKEVRAGMECGMKIVGYDDIKEGDILECYKNVEVKRTL